MVSLYPIWFSRLCLGATVLALCVIMLGAYTRLTHAGLGCPDWPGCYGEIVVPSTHATSSAYATVTIEATKAWTEMIHRYIAGSLAILVLGLCISTYCQPTLHHLRLHTTVISLLIIFQALLGMWTVTLKLHPTVVMAHLMGGMTLCALLWWLYLRSSPIMVRNTQRDATIWHSNRGIAVSCLALTLLIFIQIMLGGWTSSNYAALACTDFPGCQGSFWPIMHWREAFSLMPPLDQDYEGGWLAHPARITIHMMHRLGALIVFLYVTTLSLLIYRSAPALRSIVIVIMLILCLQLALGISNIIFALPLSIAVLHNGVACLLLLSVITLNVRAIPCK